MLDHETILTTNQLEKRIRFLRISKTGNIWGHSNAVHLQTILLRGMRKPDNAKNVDLNDMENDLCKTDTFKSEILNFLL